MNNDNVEKKYVYKDKNYLTRDGIKEEIEVFEKTIGLIPDELKSFWINEGIGFINKDVNIIKRLLSPEEIIDFINGKDIYSNIEDRNYYDSINGFVFMEYSQDIYLWVGTKSDNLGKIYYYDHEICGSFNELIKKLENNEKII